MVEWCVFQMSLVLKMLPPLSLPRAHTQGVKQSVLSVSTKISRSGDLGVIARCKHHYSVRKVVKLAFFSLLDA